MRRTTARDVVAGVGALLVLLVVALAPPWLLVHFIGWPLPTTINLDDIGHALGGASITDAFIIKALAVACWIAWAQVVACTVLELTAWFRGRSAGRVPLGGVVQPLVRQLVVSATVLVALLRPLGTSPIASHTPMQVAMATFQPAAEVVVPSPTTDTPAGEPTCVVQRRDSLWLLAEQHLGDGMRWREIYELNRGLPQPGGRTLRDPDLILPGWVLRLPADAVGLPPVPGDAPSSPAAPPPASVPGPLPGPSTTTVTVAQDSTTPGSATTNGTASPTTVPAPVDTSASTADADDDRYAVPLELAGATILAAGAIATLNGLRRRQFSRRKPGRSIPLPDGRSRDVEALLRAAAATEPTNRLDLALRLLARQLADSGCAETTRVDVVRVDGGAIEILLTNPVEIAPGPFEVVGGKVWTLPADIEDVALTAVAREQTSPTPALVTVGHLDGCQVLLNLEDRGLCLTGDRELARALIWSLTLELATSTIADDVRLIVVGTPPAGIERLDRIEMIDDVVGPVAGWAVAEASALSQLGQPSAWAARVHGVGDAWPPMVVLVDPDAVVGSIDLGGAAVVGWTDGVARTEPSLHLAVDGVRLEPLGLELAPSGLDDELLEATGELLSIAFSDEPGEPVILDLRETEDPDVTELPAGVPVVHPPLAVEHRAAPSAILVRVLGPVVIEGLGAPVTRRRVKELIVFLALHPEGVTESQIKAALWPGDEPSTPAFNQTMSRARTALGEASDGMPYVGYVKNSRYRPHVELRVDAIELERALVDPDCNDLGGVVADLVRGDPFAASGPGWHWAYTDGTAYRLAALIEQARQRRDPEVRLRL